jgi:Putative restriction endonuclease
VIWQEKVNPFVIVELLSPSTRKEDLGLLISEEGKTPYKWEVYEKILQVPYYVVFDGRSNELRLFKLINGCYHSENLDNGEYWFSEIELGLRLVFGKYQDLKRLWLRWYDRFGNLIPTSIERIKQERRRTEQEKQRAEQEKQRADLAELEIARLRALLRQSGLDNGGINP